MAVRVVLTLLVAFAAVEAAQAQRFFLPGRQRAFNQGQALGAAQQAAIDRGAVPVGYGVGAQFAPRYYTGFGVQAAPFVPYIPPAQVYIPPPQQIVVQQAPAYAVGGCGASFYPGYATGGYSVPQFAPGGCGAAFFPRY